MNLKIVFYGLLFMVFAAGCAGTPKWVGEHGERAARAIIDEYAPERRVVAGAVLGALDDVREWTDRLAEVGVPRGPDDPADYRIAVSERLSETGLDADVRRGVTDLLFPPPAEVLRSGRPRAVSQYLEAVARELGKEVE